MQEQENISGFPKLLSRALLNPDATPEEQIEADVLFHQAYQDCAQLLDKYGERSFIPRWDYPDLPRFDNPDARIDYLEYCRKMARLGLPVDQKKTWVPTWPISALTLEVPISKNRTELVQIEKPFITPASRRHYGIYKDSVLENRIHEEDRNKIGVRIPLVMHNHGILSLDGTTGHIYTVWPVMEMTHEPWESHRANLEEARLFGEVVNYIKQQDIPTIKSK